MKGESRISRLKEKMFIPAWWTIFINTFYPLRKEIYNCIKLYSLSYSSGSLLDVGCGSKPYLSLFTHCENYIGIDVEGSGHDHTQSKINKFFNGTDIPFPDNCFDAIICTEVLEHCIDPIKLISEIHRVMKPGSTCAISVPFMWPEHEMPYDFRRYNLNGIRQLCETNGLTVNEQRKLVPGVVSILILFSFKALRFFPNNYKVLRVLTSLVIAIPINLFYVINKPFMRIDSALYSGSFTVVTKNSL